MPDSKSNPFNIKSEELQEKLLNTPVGKTPRQQRLLNELAEHPEAVRILQDIASRAKGKDLVQSSLRKGFRLELPKKLNVVAKNGPLFRDNLFQEKKRVLDVKEVESLQRKKFHAILSRLPNWIRNLAGSEERHRFALKCFSAIYQNGFWLESIEQQAWTLANPFGKVSNLPAPLVSTIATSPYAAGAMETSRVISAPREWLPEVFGGSAPIHIFVIEKPTVERRSLFCFYGVPEYSDVHQFVIRSTLYEFQKPY